MAKMAETAEFQSYKEKHEQFVSDSVGSSVLEIALVCATCPVSIFMRDAFLSWMYVKKQPPKSMLFLIDLLTITMPGTLCVTLFSSNLDSFLTTMICTGFLLFVITEKAYTEPEITKKEDPKGLFDLKINPRRPFITHFRAFTSIATAVFILAVDFKVFPRRFCKTETYGTALMDVGVGGFMVANGIVSPEARGKFKAKRGLFGKFQQVLQVAKSTLPLWILGFGRLMAVKGTDYHEHVSEYGVHWNFFFTLAIVRVLSTMVLLICPVRLSWLLSMAVAVGYQCILEVYNLKEVVLMGTDGQGSREGLFNANREGICSCFGYLAIYLASVTVGSFLAKPRSKFSEWMKAFFVLLAVDIACWVLLHYIDLRVDAVSRRMGNLAFVLWMMAHQLLFLCSFFLVDLVSVCLRYLGILHRPESSSSQLCLLEAVNRNGLVYFLLANVLTGIVNKSVETIYAPAPVAYSIIMLYMLALSLITSVLHDKEITLKFW